MPVSFHIVRKNAYPLRIEASTNDDVIEQAKALVADHPSAQVCVLDDDLTGPGGGRQFISSVEHWLGLKGAPVVPVVSIPVDLELAEARLAHAADAQVGHLIHPDDARLLVDEISRLRMSKGTPPTDDVLKAAAVAGMKAMRDTLEDGVERFIADAQIERAEAGELDRDWHKGRPAFVAFAEVILGASR